MDEVALADFKQLMLGVCDAFPDTRDEFAKRMFVESAKFDDLTASANAADR